MDKILIIAYYWPPSGGAGVQRWLKLSKYLAKDNVEVHVVTVDPDKASYMQVDESLCEDIHSNIKVYRTNTFEPINYYGKLVGKSNVPTAGFSNVDGQTVKQKIISGIRSNLFIPDPRKGWKKHAYKKAVEVIETHDIKHVITTSPPHSAQLIGLKLKKQFGNRIKWIADLRDPWTDIYYYELLNHSKFSHKIDKSYERNVVELTDELITAGEKFKSSYLSKSNVVNPDKIKVIPNGFDPEDFQVEQVSKRSKTVFTLTYTGTISDYYDPNVFFVALGKLIKKYPQSPIVFKLVGMVSETIKAFIVEQVGESAVFLSTVSHAEAVNYMVNSDVLLLITQGNKGTMPGKTFEYLAAKRPIICIGSGDVADTIAKCKAGRHFERNESNKIFNYLEELFLNFKSGLPFSNNEKAVEMYSRASQAKKIKTIVFKD